MKTGTHKDGWWATCCFSSFSFLFFLECIILSWVYYVSTIPFLSRPDYTHLRVFYSHPCKCHTAEPFFLLELSTEIYAAAGKGQAKPRFPRLWQWAPIWRRRLSRNDWWWGTWTRRVGTRGRAGGPLERVLKQPHHVLLLLYIVELLFVFVVKTRINGEILHFH